MFTFLSLSMSEQIYDLFVSTDTIQYLSCYNNTIFLVFIGMLFTSSLNNNDNNSSRVIMRLPYLHIFILVYIISLIISNYSQL